MAALALVLMAGTTLANVPSVMIVTPDNVKAGDPVTITVKVDHKGTSRGHYVDNVALYDGDVVLKEWDYSPDDFIKDQDFEVAYQGSFTKDANLKARANCNLHGPGSAIKILTIK